jgi:hypothetical protein
MGSLEVPFDRPWPFGRFAAVVLALAMGFAAAPLWAGQYPQQENSPPPAPVNAAPPADGASYAQVPPTLTLPAGTLIIMRTSDYLSSDRDRPGELFRGELVQPLVVNGWVVARRGQTVIGRVDAAQKAGRVRGVSRLSVELSRLILVDGQQVPIQTQLTRASGGTSKARDAEAVGTTTGLGAIIGAAAGEGEGAGIGAVIGAGAGLAGVLLTRGRPAVIPPETELTFDLESSVTFSTRESQVAFRPVTQADYSARQGPPTLRRRSQFVPPGPDCPACGYPVYGPGPWGWPYDGGYYSSPFFIGLDEDRIGYGGYGRDFRGGDGRR